MTMTFFAKCVSLFAGLVIVLVLIHQLVLGTEQPVGASLLYSIVISLAATLIYGWIDEVYIHQRNYPLEPNDHS